MKDTFYFPHDMNATQDPKMMLLMGNCGLSAVGMYWILIEVLHQQGGRITFEAYQQFTKMYYSLIDATSEELASVQQVLIECGLLMKDNDNSVYSNRVLFNLNERKELSLKRSLAGKKSAASRGKSTHAEQVSDTSDNKGQLGKESKGKEKKEYKYGSLTCLNDGLCAEVAEYYSVSLKAVRDSRDALMLYCQKYNRRYKNYRAGLMDWVRKDIKDKKITRIVQSAPTPNMPELSPEEQAASNKKLQELRANMQIKSI